MSIRKTITVCANSDHADKTDDEEKTTYDVCTAPVKEEGKC